MASPLSFCPGWILELIRPDGPRYAALTKVSIPVAEAERLSRAGD